MLASLLINKNKVVIDDIIERRKKSCLNKLRDLFAEQESSLKTTIVRSSQDLVRITTH